MKKIITFEELKTLIEHPTVFFKTISPRKTLKQALLFDLLQAYAGLSLMIITYALLIVYLSDIATENIPKAVVVIGSVILIPLIGVVLSFVAAGIYHIILKIIGGKGSYTATYRTVVFGSFPTAVGSFFFFAGGQVLGFYTYVLQVIGFSKEHRISYWRAAVPMIVEFIVVLSMMITGAGFLVYNAIENAQGGFDLDEAKGRLEFDDLQLGIEYDDCVETDSNVFRSDEVLCATFLNVKGFEKNDKGLNVYDMDVRIWDSQGNVVRDSKRILKREEVQLENNTLAQHWMTSSLKKLVPGKYTYEFILYDVVSKKVALENKTIVITSEPRGSLDVEDVRFGESFGDACLGKKGNFTNRDVVCLDFINASGFKKGKDGLHWFDVKAKTTDSKGEVVSYSPGIYGEDGHALLKDGRSESVGILLWLEEFGHGDYTYEATLYDKIGGKSFTVKKKFAIEEKVFDEELAVESSKIGYDGYINCVYKGDVFYSSEDICLEPIVNGFEQGEDDLHWFEMNFRIIDEYGKTVDSAKSVFGEDGHVFLEDGRLSQNWVIAPLKKFKPGKYVFEVTVYDRISKKRAIVAKPFRLVEGDPPKSGTIADITKLGETHTYLIDDVSYTIEFVSITDGFKKVKFMINGESTGSLGEDEEFKTVSGKTLKIHEIYDDKSVAFVFG